MPIKVLNVAEKPSVAKEVSRILSNGGARSRRGRSQYNPIWEFCYTINGQQCDMVFTSVAGHLMELEFAAQYKRWRGCSPLDLYTAPVVKDVPADKAPLKQNLQELARQCRWLVLWLDCDREGENISFEVINVCQAVNRNLRILRARFSALIPRELQRALQQLVAPNAADAAAVDARQEIDLRIGASFTRFQTLLLQDKFDWAGGGVEAERLILSYGPCQFPTLGIIVQRAWEIQSHIPEPFWYIAVSYRPDPAAANEGQQQQQQQQGQQQRRQGQPSCEFKWARDRLFDQGVATMLYEQCAEEPTATVMQVRGRATYKRAPVPLATLEMCKSASSILRMSGERIMKLAEELYQGGWISYPRTETDVYDQGMDLRAIVNEHTNDARWGAHAAAILAGTMWKPPRAGGHDDKAHPPIHPTRYSAGEQDWSHDKRALYEFVVRHFLASCSKDAVAFETTVTIDIAGEAFRTTGLMVTERNWLDVFTWASWGGNANLPHFVEGQTFLPSELALRQGATQPPPRLSERDLIAAMERYGIGTDATVAEHIQKQIERGYAEKDGQLTFWPTNLGESLISSYRRMGLDNLWKPDLRGRIEQGISRIAAGLVTKDTILQQAINAFRVDFQLANTRTQVMLNEVARFFQRRGPGGAGAGLGFGGGPGGGGGGGGGNGGGNGGGPGGRPPGGGNGGGNGSRGDDGHGSSRGGLGGGDRGGGGGNPPGGGDGGGGAARGRSMAGGLQQPQQQQGSMQPPQQQQPSAWQQSQQQQQASSWQQSQQQQPSAWQQSQQQQPWQQQPSPWQQQQQQQQPQPRVMAVLPAPTQRGSTFDWGVKEAAKQRKQAGTKRNRAKADGSGGGGSGGGTRKPRATKASKAAAAAAAAGGQYGTENVPLCPGHHEPFRVGTSNTAKNPGRVFYKCAREEGQQCVSFAWADEFQGGDGGGGAAAAAGPSSRGAGGSSSRAAGGRGGSTQGKGRGKAAAGSGSRGAAAGGWGGAGGGGGGFVSATGAPMNVCHKCHQPGHWASSCPNA